jgi:hypothetical protein
MSFITDVNDEIFFKLKHFKAIDFICKCCNQLLIDKELLLSLEWMRELLETTPIRITSGYRCEKHNFEVSGRTGGDHPLGYAVDVGYNSTESNYILVNNLFKAKIPIVVVEKNHIHISNNKLTKRRFVVII